MFKFVPENIYWGVPNTHFYMHLHDILLRLLQFTEHCRHHYRYVGMSTTPWQITHARIQLVGWCDATQDRIISAQKCQSCRFFRAITRGRIGFGFWCHHSQSNQINGEMQIKLAQGSTGKEGRSRVGMWVTKKGRFHWLWVPLVNQSIDHIIQWSSSLWQVTFTHFQPSSSQPDKGLLDGFM